MEQEKAKEKKKRGGARPGAGRKPGSKNQITISGLLDQVYSQTAGQEYETMLIQDFISARQGNDSALVLKYHNLILNKVMNSLAKIEVTDSADALESKKVAFADALAKLMDVKKD